MHQAGLDPQAWARWPKALARGDAALLQDWAPAQVVDAFQKLCHDLLAAANGAAPRFFLPDDLPAGASIAGLTGWQKELAQAARTIDHPFQAGLLFEALVSRARSALHS